MRTLAVVLASLTLSAPALAAAPLVVNGPVQARAANPEREQNASLRRTLVSVLVLKNLNLSPEQKTELSKILADAKALREKQKAENQSAIPAEERTKALEQAIEEARATGHVSDATKSELASMRERVKENAPGFREEHKVIAQRLKALLTPEQVESLKGLRGEIPNVGRNEGARFGHKRGGRMFMMRVLSSDEFAAELAK